MIAVNSNPLCISRVEIPMDYATAKNSQASKAVGDNRTDQKNASRTEIHRSQIRSHSHRRSVPDGSAKMVIPRALKECPSSE